ncbi:MAG: dihydropteroate synthase [bacterium]|nr:dihydropteroate synthase [bacterium]
MMGVVNATPDSFSDGGRFFNATDAIRQAERLIHEGAHLIDAGGESSRPGAAPASADEEWRRVKPVVEEIAGRQGFPLSIDTVKYEVAARALEAGAAVINDISGLQQEPRLAELSAQSGAGLIVMHMRGTPRTMQSFTEYDDPIGEIRAFFERQQQIALEAGVSPAQLAFDPGIGFSKTAEQNLTLINRLGELRLAGRPLVLGVSRKSFIGRATGREPLDRDWGTAGACAAGVLRGANVIRVHHVKAIRDAVVVADAIVRERFITE